MESGPYLLLHSSARYKCGPMIPSPMVAVGDISIKDFFRNFITKSCFKFLVGQLAHPVIFVPFFWLFVLNVSLKAHEISLGHRQAWLLTFSVFLIRQAFLQIRCRVFHITPFSHVPRRACHYEGLDFTESQRDQLPGQGLLNGTAQSSYYPYSCI